MAHWRHPAQAHPQHDAHPAQLETGLPFSVWWAIAEAVAVLALLLSLKLFRLT